MDTFEKVEALRAWLSDRMDSDVDVSFRSMTRTYGFRILVGVVRPAPKLWVSLEAFEDHAVADIQNDLELAEAPGRLAAYPSQHLLYTKEGKVEKYDP